MRPSLKNWEYQLPDVATSPLLLLLELTTTNCSLVTFTTSLTKATAPPNCRWHMAASVRNPIETLVFGLATKGEAHSTPLLCRFR